MEQWTDEAVDMGYYENAVDIAKNAILTKTGLDAPQQVAAVKAAIQEILPGNDPIHG